MTGVVRVPASGGRCWICGRAAIAGEKLPGRRHKVRLLCKSHDPLVFGDASNAQTTRLITARQNLEHAVAAVLRESAEAAKLDICGTTELSAALSALESAEYLDTEEDAARWVARAFTAHHKRVAARRRRRRRTGPVRRRHDAPLSTGRTRRSNRPHSGWRLDAGLTPCWGDR